MKLSSYKCIIPYVGITVEFPEDNFWAVNYPEVFAAVL